MLFTSISFLYYFLPIILFIYFIVPNKMKNVVLFIFSLIFYLYGEPKYIILMLLEILIAYIGARLIEKYKSKDIFIITLIIHISLLVFFKYTDFLILNINSIFKVNVPLQNIALPIGISFYTFQIISYVIDVYRGDVKVQKNLLNSATYVSLFPQLVAGPIVRYQTIADELENRRESLDSFVSGIKRFMLGFAKKVLIALFRGNEKEALNYEIKIDKLKLPIKKGQKVGILKLKDGNKVISKVELTVKKDVKKASIPLAFFYSLISFLTALLITTTWSALSIIRLSCVTTITMAFFFSLLISLRTVFVFSASSSLVGSSKI